MRRFCLFVTACATLVCFLAISSCSSDDDSTSYTNDCAIKSVVMGTLYRDYTTQLSSGKDTSYVITLPASLYPLHIDHLKGLIYNTDSLPVGTRTNKVRFSTFTADGTIAYRLESGKDTLYSTSDTLDMTTPRIFTVYASSGIGRKQYTMQINVAQTDPDAYSWQQEAQAPENLRGIENVQFCIKDKKLYIFGTSESGKNFIATRETTHDAPWATADIEGVDATQPLKDITPFKGKFYAIQGTNLCVSEDGQTWTPATDTETVERILGAGSSELYFTANNSVYRTTDGATRTAETLDDNISLLPTEQVQSAYWASKSNPDAIEYVLLAGYDGEEQRIWKKEVNLASIETNNWSYYPITEDNGRVLPRLGNMSLVYCNEQLCAFGSKDGTMQAWISQDGGRTWKKQTKGNIIPASLKEEEGLITRAEEDGHLWIFNPKSGNLWKGIQNKLLQ